MLNMGVEASENEVINLIYRKIRNAMSITPEPDDFEDVLMHLRELINESRINRTEDNASES